MVRIVDSKTPCVENLGLPCTSQRRYAITEVMQYRQLGKTGVSISVLAYGAGPVSTLMVGHDFDRQFSVIQAAIERGINWFDTAATYGAGESETNLGRVLSELNVGSRVHLATKVRLADDDLNDLRRAVMRSFEASLKRLKREKVTLLQLHNSITAQRGDEPTSITPEDVLKKGGIADLFEELQSQNLVSHIGLTGIGQAPALKTVVDSGRFSTMQVPYHLLNPSAGRDMPVSFSETNYGNIIEDCANQKMGVMAIRALAGGALAGNPPSPHTLKTPFFPLALYERDLRRAEYWKSQLTPERNLSQEAIRFSLGHPQISSAIVGFGDHWQIDMAISAMESTEPLLSWVDEPSSI